MVSIQQEKMPAPVGSPGVRSHHGPGRYELTSRIAVGPLADWRPDEVKLGELQVLGDGDLCPTAGPPVQHVLLRVADWSTHQAVLTRRQGASLI